MLNKRKFLNCIITGLIGVMFTTGCQSTENLNINNIQDTNTETEIVDSAYLESVKQGVEDMIIEGLGEEALGKNYGQFEVEIVGNEVILVYHQEPGTTEYAIKNGEWDGIVEGYFKIYNNVITAINEAGEGFEGISFKLCCKENSKYTLVIYDGKITYNEADFYEENEVLEESAEENTEEYSTAILERDIEREYTKYNIYKNYDILKDVKEDEFIEIEGEISLIRKTGEKGAIIYLKCPDGYVGYQIELKGLLYEDIKVLEKGDIIKIQGRYDGVGEWSLNLEGENYGAYHVYVYNLYKMQY